MSHNAYAVAQSYAQLGQFLYYVEFSSPYNIIRRFNVDTGSEDAYANAVADGAQSYGTTDMCLAAVDADDGYLFVVGGGRSADDLAKTFILNMTSDEWFEGPLLNVARGYHACAVNSAQDTLFAVGGYNKADGFLDSVERLSVGDIENVNSYQWVLLADTLHDGLFLHRVIRHGDDILTVGAGNDDYVKIMNVIDASTASITVAGSLDIGLSQTAAVTVGAMAYSFGGMTGSLMQTVLLNSWRSLPLRFALFPGTF